MSPRERLQQMIADEQKTIDFFEETGTRQLHAEGFGPWEDVTEATIAESRRRIAIYEAIIARFHGTIDSGG
jgi:hypothetical protein